MSSEFVYSPPLDGMITRPSDADDYWQPSRYTENFLASPFTCNFRYIEARFSAQNAPCRQTVFVHFQSCYPYWGRFSAKGGDLHWAKETYVVQKRERKRQESMGEKRSR